ncbi:MAG TPA: hypothetical protein VF637_04320 [Sphingomicrobium sp.]|jgi:hypothetical protein
MSGVNWNLMGQGYDALQSLRSYGQAQQDGYREEQIGNARADRTRQTEARDALGELVRAGMGTPPAQGGLSPGLQRLMDAGSPQPQAQQGRAAALDRLSRADPELAMKAQAEERKATKEQLAIFHDLNSQAMQLMGGVSDQASYDVARRRGQALFGRYGLSLDEYQLPDQYTPEVVRGLMMQALDTDKQLTQLRQDRRLDADIEDDEADNERADRNTDSVITDRSARRGLVARGQDMSDARGRYGIGVASADRRRGQDLTSTDRRRGQDISATRPRTGRGAGGGANIPTISSPEQARQLPSGTTFRTPDGRLKVAP